MERNVQALGGAFIYSENPKALADWYAKHLELPLSGEMPYCVFPYKTEAEPAVRSVVVFSIMKFPEGQKGGGGFMLNFRVNDLKALVTTLRAAGVEVTDATHYEGQGLFAHAIDGDGNRVELWEDHFDYDNPPQG